MARKRRRICRWSKRIGSRMNVVWRDRAYKVGRRLHDAGLIDVPYRTSRLSWEVIGLCFIEDGLEGARKHINENVAYLDKLRAFRKEHPDYQEDAKLRNRLK